MKKAAANTGFESGWEGGSCKLGALCSKTRMESKAQKRYPTFKFAQDR